MASAKKSDNTLLFFRAAVTELEAQSKAGFRTRVYYRFNVPKDGYVLNLKLISAKRKSILDPPQIEYPSTMDIYEASCRADLSTVDAFTMQLKRELLLLWHGIYFRIIKELEYGLVPAAHAVELRHIVDLVSMDGYDKLGFRILRPYKR